MNNLSKIRFFIHKVLQKNILLLNKELQMHVIIKKASFLKIILIKIQLFIEK